MLWVLRRFANQLKDPAGYFGGVRDEGWKPSFAFFAWVTLLISVITPILNLFGVESTDLSSSYQAQIIAYRFVRENLLDTYGAYAYLIEAVLIFPLRS
jgi:hypothetical protein